MYLNSELMYTPKIGRNDSFKLYPHKATFKKDCSDFEWLVILFPKMSVGLGTVCS